MSSLTLDQSKPRASEFARCSRMAYYRAAGHVGQLDPAAEEYLYRGHVFEEIEVRRMEARYGRDQVVRQPAFDWGMGEHGHSDAFIIPTRQLVEVKSGAAPSLGSPTVEMAVAQLKLALRYYEHPEVGPADHGLVHLIDPRRMRPADQIKVVLTDEDREQQAAQLQVLREALALHDLSDGGSEAPPPRVCTLPSQARGRLCPFAEVCFAAWEAPAVYEARDPEVAELARRIYHLQQELRPRKADYEELEQEIKDLKGLLSEEVPEGESVVGPYAVHVTHVRRSPKFEPKLAKAAGFPLEALEEFYSAGAEYDLVRVTLAGEPGELDYGDEVPFA